MLTRRPARLLRPAAAAPPVVPRTTPRAATANAGPSRGRGQVVLDVQNLKTYFFTYDGIVRALDGVNLSFRRAETTGIVGETGCGKSVTAFSISRLIAEPGRVVSGKVLYRGANLLWGLEKEARFRRLRGGRVKVIRSFRRVVAANERMSAVRGRGISMIFQEPSQAMNPVFSVADQLGETLLLHRGVEIVNGLLEADQGHGGEAGDVGGASGAFGSEGGAGIDQLLQSAAHATPEELRAATDAYGNSLGVGSLGAELYYLLRPVGVRPTAAARGVRKAVRRVRLSRWQRNYLRHQRRVMVLSNRLRDVYLKEMTLGKSLAFQRRRLRARIRWEKTLRFYYGIAGIKRRVTKPLQLETFWRSVQLLEGVRIANPAQVAKSYPHELSGGMLQRVMIAMAMSAEPDILIADEPTTALDVPIQAQILDLMRGLKQRAGTAILLITHDLAVVAEVADRLCVMYAGQIVERGPVRDVFRQPLHPYTQGLLASIPRLDQPDRELRSIAGSVPNLIDPPSGCRFHPRCPHAMPICREARPPTTLEGPDHAVACYLYHGPRVEG